MNARCGPNVETAVEATTETVKGSFSSKIYSFGRDVLVPAAGRGQRKRDISPVDFGLARLGERVFESGAGIVGRYAKDNIFPATQGVNRWNPFNRRVHLLFPQKLPRIFIKRPHFAI